MVGAGASVFAVWGYVIAHMRADGKPGEHKEAQVDLNPKLLAFILGETEEEMERVISLLCGPDPKSRTPDEEGRRLIKVGQYAYRVVNGAKYMDIRNAEDRREYFREAKRRERERKSPRVLEEEAIQERVRDKFNPNWREQAASRGMADPTESRLTLKERVDRRVKADPLVKQDRAQMRKKGKNHEHTQVIEEVCDPGQSEEAIGQGTEDVGERWPGESAGTPDA